MRPEPVPTSRNRLALPCGAAWTRAVVNERAIAGGQEDGEGCAATWNGESTALLWAHLSWIDIQQGVERSEERKVVIDQVLSSGH